MSLHLTQANALFLHIPKTGGTWVEETLKANGVAVEYAPAIPMVSWRHSLLSHYTQRYRYTFAFVRHPQSWYESWWKFQAKAWCQFEPGVWHPQRVLERCAADDFTTFIRNCLTHEPCYVSRMYEWYLGTSGSDLVDCIGHYETLADDLCRILRHLGYRLDEGALRRHPRANVSLKRSGEPIWDETLRQQLLALESPALRRFYTPPARTSSPKGKRAVLAHSH